MENPNDSEIKLARYKMLNETNKKQEKKSRTIKNYENDPSHQR